MTSLDEWRDECEPPEILEDLEPLGPPFPDPDNPMLEMIVRSTLERVDAGATTVAEALLYAAVAGYAEGWGDAESLLDQED